MLALNVALSTLVVAYRQQESDDFITVDLSSCFGGGASTLGVGFAAADVDVNAKWRHTGSIGQTTS